MGGLRSFPALEPHAHFHAPWWVAGGRALDLWIGRQTRAHQDVDVAILRDDQKHLHEVFGGWELYYATPDHRLLPYRPECWLEVPLHGVWVRPATDAPWLCEFLLNEHEDQQWVYRRNPAVRKPLAEVGVTALGGVPILVPEIVLLYKAHELTEKDEADFRSALPHLTPSQKAWLLGRSIKRGRTILGQGECVARRCSPTELYGRTSENARLRPSVNKSLCR